MAFRFIAGNHHPGHDTISSFRKRFLPEIKGWFEEILLIGKEMKLIRMGNIYIDGTKVQANASKHKAMSYGYMNRLEKQLKTEIEQLLSLAAAKDEQEQELDLNVPKEIERRQERLEKIKKQKKLLNPGLKSAMKKKNSLDFYNLYSYKQFI